MADARARISWLHVSDLHVAKESLGGRSARRPGSELWAEVLREFLADLDMQLDATGLRPDLVLVTGDLAYSGAAKQYVDLDAELLHPLLAHLRARGCDAVLLAVPGNHDVQRPSGAAKRGYRLLREYDTLDDQDDDLADLRRELWLERNAAFLSPLFANYAAWAERSMLPGLAERTLPSGLRIEGLHRSHLPGDLSVIASRDGLRLLLVGLNSSWIQFDGGDFKGKLHVPLEQLHAALSPDEHAALRRFDAVDASLLLMHHPRDWLSPAAVRTFDGYVYPARDERFSAFMFGHMHEARAEMSSGNGGAMRHFYQSPSLFGLEHYGETQARLDVGYTLGALYEDEEIRLWVRRLGRRGRFDVDPDLHREPDGALVLRAARPRAAPRVTMLPDDQRADHKVRPSDRAQLGAWLLSRHDKLELLAPTATFSYPFDEVYIPLEIAMQEAWRSRSLDGDLAHGMGRDIALPEIFARARDGREVMIFGNPGAGKTTTLEKICHQMLIEGGEAVGLPRSTLPLLLPLRHATREDLAHDDPLFELARREIVRGDAPLSPEVLARLWAQGGLLLLLDGLDEVADIELRDGLVHHVVRSAPARRRQGVRHIVSSRFSGVTRSILEVLDAGFLRLDVRPLRRDRIEALVHSWFRAAKCWQVAPRTTEERARVEAEARDDAERVLAELRRIEHEDFEFKNLVATPLLLTLLCAVALANGQIPHKRPEFYQRCLEVLLRRYTQKTGRSAPVQEPEALRILQEAAYGLHEARRRDGLSAGSFAAWASQRADRSGRARMGPAEAGELLEWLHQQAGVLTKFGHDDYGFAHLTFQEYLSALHIAYGGEEPIQTLADRFGDPWWQEVTLLCLAMPLRRTFDVFMTRVLEGDRWLADALGDDEGAPEVQRESKLPIQLLRECWEDSEERNVEPFLRVLERPRSGGGWMGWVRKLLGRPQDARARIDQQRIGVMQLLLGETDPELVVLAYQLSIDPNESEAVRAIASELVARARRHSELREPAPVLEIWDGPDSDALAPEGWEQDASHGELELDVVLDGLELDDSPATEPAIDISVEDFDADEPTEPEPLEELAAPARAPADDEAEADEAEAAFDRFAEDERQLPPAVELAEEPPPPRTPTDAIATAKPVAKPSTKLSAEPSSTAASRVARPTPQPAPSTRELARSYDGPQLESAPRSEPPAPPQPEPVGGLSLAPVPKRAISTDTSPRSGKPRRRKRRDERPAPGMVIADKWELTRYLGSGGLGQVFEAWHTKLGSLFAIKLLDPALASAELKARFLEEARAMARVTSKHLVRVTDYGVLPGGTPYLVMERLWGKTLRERLGDAPQPSIGEALGIGEEILESLTELHERGFVHASLKPENVFLSSTGNRVRLLDFGFAQTWALARSHAGRTMPSGYVAPELLGRQAPSVASDLHAVGTMLLELLASPTVRGTSAAPSLERLAGSVPDAVRRFVAHALEPDPLARPKSAHAMLEELRAGASGLLPAREASREAREPLATIRTPPTAQRAQPVTEAPSQVRADVEPDAPVRPEPMPAAEAQREPAAPAKPTMQRKPKPQPIAAPAPSPPPPSAAAPVVTHASTGAHAAASKPASAPALTRSHVPGVKLPASAPGSAAAPTMPNLRPPTEPMFGAPAGPPRARAAAAASSPTSRSEGGAVPGARAWPATAEAAAPTRIDIDIDNVCVEPITKMRFLWVSNGHFMMGSAEEEPGSFDDERPVHLVRLRGFWLAETPVTNAQYAEYVKADGSVREPRYWRDRGLSGRDQPVVAVSWHEARAFCEWLSRTSGWSIALPSEAQWEYAARGVEGRRYPWGNEPPDETRACYGLGSTTGRTAPVGQYPRGRGPFGHLDLAGNVWEWCRDTGDPAAYSRKEIWSQVDPVIEDAGAELRVCRGGGWYDPSPALRSARRTLCPGVGSSVAQGFRVCRILGGR